MIDNFGTFDSAVTFYRSSRSIILPSHLKDQFDRAASSIVLNLAEGAGRTGRADSARFFSIAMGSVRECQAILDLSTTDQSEAVHQADSLAAHLYRLLQGCRKMR